MEKYHPILLITLFSFVVCFSMAQTYEDVVYLKNGSVIHGLVMEQIPNESIKIKSDKNTFVFKMEEITKITKEEVSNSNASAQSIPSSLAIKQEPESIKLYIENKINTESRGMIKLIKFTKTDGASRIVDGQNWYDMSFTVEILPVRDVWKGGNNSIVAFSQGYWPTFEVATAEPQGWDAFISNGLTKYSANQTILLTGYSKSYKTEKGWNISEFRFSKEEISSATSISNAVTENAIQNSNSFNENLKKLAGRWDCVLIGTGVYDGIKQSGTFDYDSYKAQGLFLLTVNNKNGKGKTSLTKCKVSYDNDSQTFIIESLPDYSNPYNTLCKFYLKLSETQFPLPTQKLTGSATFLSTGKPYGNMDATKQ